MTMRGTSARKISFIIGREDITHKLTYPTIKDGATRGVDRSRKESGSRCVEEEEQTQEKEDSLSSHGLSIEFLHQHQSSI